MKKIISALICGTAGAIVGYLLGSSIHDTIAYLFPLKPIHEMNLDIGTYISMYEKYSYNMKELFEFVFGTVGGSLGAYFGYEVFKDEKREGN